MNLLLAKVFRGPLDLNGPLLGRIFYLFEYARTYVEERTEAFDARFGTDTASPTFERGQKTSVHFYVPTTASVVYDIIRRLPLKLSDHAFVDLGSGKGRALLIASEFPFKRIVGVELSEHLHRIAKANVDRFRPLKQPCRTFDLRCMDALDYEFEDEPLVLFLFDPFSREILEQIIRNLEASLLARPRNAFVVYVYPQFEDALKRSPILHKVDVARSTWQPWNEYAVYATSSCTEEVSRAAE